MRERTHTSQGTLGGFSGGYAISQYRLAKDIHVPARRAITADTAQFWMNLQASYDLAHALEELGSRLEKEVHPHAA